MGDDTLIHKYSIAKNRLENEFGFVVTCMPHALKGIELIAKNPQLRAQDLMDAFQDPSVCAIFCSIGGDDTIRTLPYINLDIIRNHPKIFMGYSDTTIHHFMLHKAGLVSFYGPSILCEFGEYVNRITNYITANSLLNGHKSLNRFDVNIKANMIFAGEKGDRFPCFLICWHSLSFYPCSAISF
ncbi:MAG: LD-carboxypeptidase [Clostridiales bacterium]|nr:LD-carboxypeptidase [Clostridiales bacterium]